MPNSFHYLSTRGFLARHPHATLRVVPGLAARVPSVPAGETLTEEAVATWRGTLEHAVLGPVDGIAEVALFHVPTATLIVTDLAFHLTTFERPLDRVVWRLSGIPTHFGPSRTARLLLLRDRRVAAAFLARVLAWPFERVLAAHGAPLETDARRVFRRAFMDWL